MSQKTKLEIIEELFDNYYVKHPEKRSIDRDGACVYLDSETGNKCAVGMCLTDDFLQIAKYILGGVLSLQRDGHCSSIDEVLKEEYRGHDKRFWISLQEMHDELLYWHKTGLTEEGEEYLSKLKERAIIIP
jgi:hypothetical protein